MNGGTISGNQAKDDGGGVCNKYVFSMNGGTISGNNAIFGGGVCNSNTFNMNGGTISGNNANYNGGGVYNYNTFNMNGGTISGNDAHGTFHDWSVEDGGGVYNIIRLQYEWWHHFR